MLYHTNCVNLSKVSVLVIRKQQLGLLHLVLFINSPISQSYILISKALFAPDHMSSNSLQSSFLHILCLSTGTSANHLNLLNP